MRLLECNHGSSEMFLFGKTRWSLNHLQSLFFGNKFHVESFKKLWDAGLWNSWEDVVTDWDELSTAREPISWVLQRSPPAGGINRDTMTSFQPCTRSTKAGLEVKMKCLSWEIETLKKNDHDRRSIMSIPLMEIKVDVIDPTLLYSTLIKGSQLLCKKQWCSPRHQRSWMT